MPVAANPTPTSRLRLEKQTVDSNENAWGTRLNQSLDLVDLAFSTEEVTVSSDVTLTSTNYADNQSRALCLILSGDGGYAVTTPAVDKPYLVINNCTSDVTMKPSGGTTATIRAGTIVWYYNNAAGDTGYVADPTLDKIKAPVASVAMGSQKITGLADGVADSDAVTIGQTVGLVTAAEAARDTAVTASNAAVLAYDSFDDRYLGAKSSEPSVDNDGDPLITGALFFDTVAGAMKVYDGAAWIALDVVTDYSDSTFRISDDGDATKKVAFEASGITTGTTRTLTVPDASGTLALTSDIPAAGIGDGQTWQTVTRTYNTSYQNTTGKPIVFHLVGYVNDQMTIQTSPDNSTWTTVSQALGGGGTDNTFISAIIPDNFYYKYTPTYSFTVQFTAELR